MEDRETLNNLHESINTLKQLVRSQAEEIRQLAHERDLLLAASSYMLTGVDEPDTLQPPDKLQLR